VQGTILNRPYVSVTVCVPGTSNCQTINDVLLDTGSTGLRLFSSVLMLPVPIQQAPPYGAVYECQEFENGFMWGPIATADVKLSGETAQSVVIQLAGDTTYVPPTQCSNGQSALSSPQSTDFNGILGVAGKNDCGNTTCLNLQTELYYYWFCSSTNGPVPFCGPSIEQPVAQQVWNPVALFPTDNNGLVIDLPGIPQTGGTNVQGSVFFGLGTETNNQLGSATTYQFPLAAVVGGGTFPAGIDTGTVDFGLLSSGLVGLPQCGPYYCPSSPTTFGVEIIGSNGEASTIDITAADPASINQGATADSALVGPGFGNSVMMGLPFFYNRRVVYSFGTQNGSEGAPPFVAF
jgi:hypothetical protein